MRIGNDYVQVKIGNKTYTKKNMILNTMLNNIFANQLNPSIFRDVNIDLCAVKLDTPLENLSYDSQLSKSDFDIFFQKPQTLLDYKEKEFEEDSVLSNDNIKINYNFTIDGYFEYNDNVYEPQEFNMFVGRKITAIGFGDGYTFLAVADVSKMNIIINNNEKLQINRTDTYQSDGICIGFEYPLHLINGNAYCDLQTGYLGSYKVAKLYSIGLGNKEGLMEDEHIIDLNEQVVGDNYITMEFSDIIKIGHYPSETLFPGFYPTKDNSRYIILKYRLCRLDIVNNLTELDEYYTMSYRYDLSQYKDQEKDITFTLKIERM